jgi:molybdenum cofactor cytidylyltransferase
MSAVYAVVLAAGRGERFGGDKLSAPLHGRPLLAHTLDAVQAARAAGSLTAGCVVVAENRPELEALARAAGLEPVTNPEAKAGLGTSLRRAVEWLERTRAPGGPAAAVIFLGDQPNVAPRVVAALVAAWNGGAEQFVRPRYAAVPDEPSHPTLVDAGLWQVAGGLSGDAGLGPALQERGIAVTLVDVPGANPDVDTRADLTNLEGTTG